MELGVRYVAKHLPVLTGALEHERAACSTLRSALR